MSGVAHFFGGPWDGRVQEMEWCPYRLIVPILGKIEWVEETVPMSELHYVKRGPVLGGHCYYDVDPATNLPGGEL